MTEKANRSSNNVANLYSFSMCLTELEFKTFDPALLQEIRELAIMSEKRPQNMDGSYVSDITKKILAIAAFGLPSCSHEPFSTEIYTLKKGNKDILRLTHTEEGLFLEVPEPIHFKRM